MTIGGMFQCMRRSTARALYSGLTEAEVVEVGEDSIKCSGWLEAVADFLSSLQKVTHLGG